MSQNLKFASSKRQNSLVFKLANKFNGQIASKVQFRPIFKRVCIYSDFENLFFICSCTLFVVLDFFATFSRPSGKCRVRGHRDNQPTIASFRDFFWHSFASSRKRVQSRHVNLAIRFMFFLEFVFQRVFLYVLHTR